MKHFIFMAFVLFLSYTSPSIAQDYGDYSLPQTSSLTELQKYIGQHVQILPYKGHATLSSYDDKRHDEYLFKNKFHGIIGEIYTISAVKVKKQIELELISNAGEKIEVKVNLDGKINRKGLLSCRSFFLIDKFNGDKAKNRGKVFSIIGKDFANLNNEIVAKVVDCQMQKIENSYPQIRYKIQSNIDNSAFWNTIEKADSICKKVGIILKNPLVKIKYKIIGVDDTTFIGNYHYKVQNLNDNTVKLFHPKNIENSVFKEDLSGHYISTLRKVEKPQNPSIRYGKTTVVKDGKNISKYSYVDNVIDILIFGTSKKFFFILKNVSKNSIKVVWDEATFVNFDGTSSKVMHNGIKYSEREKSQPATTIIKGAKIEDCATPTSNVYFYESSIGGKDYSEWKEKSMYPNEEGLSPGQLKLMLPIQIKNVVNEYIFVFDVTYEYYHPERLNI